MQHRHTTKQGRNLSGKAVWIGYETFLFINKSNKKIKSSLSSLKYPFGCYE